MIRFLVSSGTPGWAPPKAYRLASGMDQASAVRLAGSHKDSSRKRVPPYDESCFTADHAQLCESSETSERLFRELSEHLQLRKVNSFILKI